MNQHYFTSLEPTSDTDSMTVSLRDTTHNVITAPGIFSADKVDKATQVLVDKLEEPDFRVDNAADVGCGWGPIALVLADMFKDATIWASDVNERAVDVTAKNLKKAGCAHARVGLDEALRQEARKAGTRFDLIASNPPIRIGKKALHELLVNWLDLLAPHGQMWLVVGKNLGADSLAAWLRERGCEVERIGSKKGFRVLCVEHGASDQTGGAQ